ncbi:MAG TPA: LysR family transcriptional regulator [Solirubrobacteraceae bacterium]|nr:LysR family transcriptional regulator [Solirubrobacteraceae bacterium]
MDERRLRYFLAIVDEGSVTAAAERLVIAQPSLSQALRAFERELGVDLFHRTGRGLTLSSAGAALVGPAREILRTIDAARGAVEAVAEVLAGTLELAALATLAIDPLADLLGRFRRAHPGVAVRVAEPDGVVGLRALVAGGDCELGLVDLEPPSTGFEVVPIGSQEMLVVLPPGTARAGQPLTADELAAVPLVVSPRGTSTRNLLDQALGAASVTPQIAVETAARDAIVPLVLAGAGAALLPAPLASDAKRRGAIVLRTVPTITRPVGLIHRGRLSPAARAFVELVS